MYHSVELPLKFSLGAPVISQDTEGSIADDDLPNPTVFNYLPTGRLSAKGCEICLLYNMCVCVRMQ